MSPLIPRQNDCRLATSRSWCTSSPTPPARSAFKTGPVMVVVMAAGMSVMAVIAVMSVMVVVMPVMVVVAMVRCRPYLLLGPATPRSPSRSTARQRLRSAVDLIRSIGFLIGLIGFNWFDPSMRWSVIFILFYFLPRSKTCCQQRLCSYCTVHLFFFLAYRLFSEYAVGKSTRNFPAFSYAINSFRFSFFG